MFNSNWDVDVYADAHADASSSPCERSASDLSASSSSSVAIRAICAADQSSDEAMATAHLLADPQRVKAEVSQNGETAEARGSPEIGVLAHSPRRV